ncbi:MAG: tetratricopeptide repeat protein [Muribaculaceae bacterium]|nr:tetratricopeptide repeat protein [Muribaculaceae bacterium]
MRIYLYIILMLLMLPGACVRPDRDARLTAVAQMVQKNPEAALRALDSIDVTALGENDRHYYDLLSIKAKDKAYIVHTSDSLILDVTDYYRRHHDKVLYPEALYYGGRVYSDMGDFPTALRYFQNALETIPEGEEYLPLKSTVSSQTGRLLNTLRLYEQAVPYLEESIRLDSITGDSLSYIDDRQLLGAVYLHNGKYGAAESEFLRAREIAELVSPEAVWPQDMYLAAISEKEGRTDLAVSLIGPGMRFISPDYFSISSAYAARIYFAAGRLDSAYHYAHKLVASSSPRNRQNGYKILLAPEMTSYIPADTARRYVREYREVIESLLSRHDAEAALIQNSMYNYQVHERERHRAEADKMRYERRAFWLLCGVLALAAVVFYLKYKNQRQLLRLRIALSNIGALREALAREKTIEVQPRSDDEPSDVLLSESVGMGECEPLRADDSSEVLRKRLRDELMKLYQESTERNIGLSPRIVDSDAYRLLQRHIEDKSIIGENSTLWKQLEEVILQASPDFKTNLQLLTGGRLTQSDLHTAYLVKCHVAPTQMSCLLGRTKGSISSRRESIGFKVFNEKLSVKVIDGIIRLL